MIARIWRGRTRAEALTEYAGYIGKSGFDGLRRNEENRGAMVLAREDGNEAEFLVVSLWDSMDDIRSFAGDDTEKAVYYPEDDRFLLEMEPTVRHYQVTNFEVE